MDIRFYRSLFLICLIFILLPGISQGEGDIGFPFLKIGIGARQAGMGGVFTGIGDDIQTLYLNPRKAHHPEKKIRIHY